MQLNRNVCESVLEGNVCEIYYRDMTKGFVAGASTRIGCGEMSQGCVARKCTKDMSRGYVPGMCCRERSQG